MPTLFDKLIAAGLPIESATEDGQISGFPNAAMTEEQQHLFCDILIEHFQPSEYAAIKKPKDAERIAALEAALLELMMGGL
jgi:hypothetical protein